jgi:hypothetical protein
MYYYKAYNVKIAPPSGEDIGVFLRGSIQTMSVIHIVLSVEGLYVMIANPCFVEQARNLLHGSHPLSKSYYHIAVIGAEILGMTTHEFRSKWTTDEWIQWIRNRFVCSNVDARSYEQDIRKKFTSQCPTCPPLDDDIRAFNEQFKHVVRTSFELAPCTDVNALSNSRWKEGNWVDVEFVSWDDAERLGGIHLNDVVYV